MFKNSSNTTISNAKVEAVVYTAVYTLCATITSYVWYKANKEQKDRETRKFSFKK